VDPIDRVKRATAFAAEKINNVKPDDMTKPTPCSEFDVHALLNHVIGGLGMLTEAAKGGKPEMPSGDQCGSDPAATYDERRAALLAALRQPGVLERTWQMPFGSMEGSMMATIAFMEHLTHGWDVAKATGQDTAMPADLVQECMAVVSPMDAMLRTPGVCGPAVSVPDSASLEDKLIAFLGRQP
jgi:uncharacterized protein (TIGR03086 family)